MENTVLFLTIVITFLDYCTCHCPDGWVYFQGSCYLFSHEDKTFVEAEHYCRQYDAHLVKIDNSTENAFVKSQSADLKDTFRWIGLTDTDIEGLWKWTDGTSLGYTDWYPGEPNGQKAEDCGALWQHYKYQFIDVSCTGLYKPICEIAEPGCSQGGEHAIIG